MQTYHFDIGVSGRYIGRRSESGKTAAQARAKLVAEYWATYGVGSDIRVAWVNPMTGRSNIDSTGRSD